MNYGQTRKDALRRRKELSERLEEISEEAIALQAEKQNMQRELAAVDLILEGVDIYRSDAPLEGESSGVADHVRRLLQQTPVPLLPTQIRDFLESAGITGSSRRNLLIGVHNVLTRLELYLETVEINGRPAYRWKREPDKAPKKSTVGSDESQTSGLQKQRHK